MTDLIVSVHDVSPATETESEWWIRRLEDYGLTTTLLVIPGPWRGAAMIPGDRLSRRLRRWAEAGHEVSLHGWNHTQARGGGRVARIIARGAGEFADLDEDKAKSRLEQGRAMLESNGLSVSGFTPPGWLISAAAATQVLKAGLSYYTTHTAIHHVAESRTLRVPALSHRSQSLLAPVGTRMVWAGFHLSRAMGTDLRLAIHPDDTHDIRLVDTTIGVIETALSLGWNVGPYGRFLEAT